MSKMRMLDTRFWIDTYISDLDPSEKLVFIYFLTNERTELCGVYEIPLKTVALDTGIDREMINKILSRFSQDKKIFYYDGWVSIRNSIKYQNTNNQYIVKGIEVGLKKVPKNVLAKIRKEQETSGDLRSPEETYTTPEDINFNLNLNSNLNFNSSSAPTARGEETPGGAPDEEPIDLVRGEGENFVEPQIVEIVNGDASPKRISEVMEVFRRFDPNLEFGNKTQRSAVAKLIENNGFDQTMAYSNFILEHQGEPYVPVLTTPLMLLRGFSRFISFYLRLKNEGNAPVKQHLFTQKLKPKA